MATVFTETTRPGAFIVSEANGSRSREVGRLASGNDLVAGAVLGKITTANTATSGSNTGNGTISVVTIGTDAINGTYTITITAEDTNAGTFSVVAPNGASLDDGTVGVAYVGSHINFTIYDGSEDFHIGDSCTVDVVFGEYAEFNPAASDGSQTAVAVLYAGVDASSAEQDCVIIARDAEVNEAELTFKSGVTEVQKAVALNALKTVGIIAR